MALALAALGAPGVAQEQETPPRTRPNVLVIVADDLGHGDLGFQGCTDIPTPSLDRLAREGVRCTDAYVTAPRCAPSRCGLLTGRHQQRYGCEIGAEMGLPRDVPTLAELLRPAGYESGLIGKWHLGRKPEHHPLERGFDEFFGFVGGVSISLPRDGVSIPRILRGREPVQVPGFLTDALATEAQAFLERHARDPFFLLLSFQAPHEPVEAPPEALARFAALPDPVRQRYAASVATLDAAIGRVLETLRALELDQRTLVLFLSDNGGPQPGPRWNGASNAPLRGAKGGLYEAGIRVPFVVRWTGVLPAGSTFAHPITALDLVPTALAMAGLEAPPGLDGVDLLPHLAGRSDAPPHAALHWRFNFPPNRPEEHRWAIRVGDWKLLHSPERDELTGPARGVGELGLYDLRHDPGEAHDLAAAQPERVAELKRRWQVWNEGLPTFPSPDGPVVDEAEDE
ncbi:MAG TPA: sulfatase-like hydrolase/transferase [Planctomycetota bacterium]